jgi:NAD(P)-dependent dehydrogenase (short-subunit alcohol dehydrogenase family)
MGLDFVGKTALVTGGANGIGWAAARVLAGGGARVWIGDLDQEGAEAKAREIAGHALTVDVTRSDSVDAAFERVGELDIVIANAGIPGWAGLADTEDDLWGRILSVNLTGVFHTIRAAARNMKPRGRGSIVITASTNSYDGEANLIAYNATKAGVLGILHTAANELGPYGIRVNAVCPGLIRTRLTVDMIADDLWAREYFRHIPLGRSGETDEVGNAIGFLASDLASFVTGATLLVDGGQMAAKYSVWDEKIARFADGRWSLNAPSELE